MLVPSSPLPSKHSTKTVVTAAHSNKQECRYQEENSEQSGSTCSGHTVKVKEHYYVTSSIETKLWNRSSVVVPPSPNPKPKPNPNQISYSSQSNITTIPTATQKKLNRSGEAIVSPKKHRVSNNSLIKMVLVAALKTAVVLPLTSRISVTATTPAGAPSTYTARATTAKAIHRCRFILPNHPLFHRGISVASSNPSVSISPCRRRRRQDTTTAFIPSIPSSSSYQWKNALSSFDNQHRAVWCRVPLLPFPPSLVRTIVPSYVSSEPFTTTTTTTTTTRFNSISNRGNNGGDETVVPFTTYSSDSAPFLQKVYKTLVQQILPQIRNNNNTSIYNDHKNDNDSPQIVCLLCVSGGCDSVALLHSVMALVGGSNQQQQQPSFSSFEKNNSDKTRLSPSFPCVENVHVVHYDHRRRGEESNNDRRLVQRLCEEYCLPFHCYTWDDDNGDDENGKERKTNVPKKKFSQESARDWRRTTSLQLINDVLQKREEEEDCGSRNSEKYGVILTAHHKDDTEETILLKLLRGVHVTNLTGMDVVRPAWRTGDGYSFGVGGRQEEIEEEEKGKCKGRIGRIGRIYFAKPMLGVRKNEIKDFLEREGLEWREDASNASDKYLRNRVRNELMPLLKDLVKGEDVLERRLANLETQSRKLHQDLVLRAQSYYDDYSSDTISTKTTETTNNGDNKTTSPNRIPRRFPLPNPPRQFTSVDERALYDWIQYRSGGTVQPTYDKVALLGRQIMEYTERRRWRIGVGGGWDVRRVGDVMELVRGKGQEGNKNKNNNNNNDNDGDNEEEDEWILESTETTTTTTELMTTLEPSNNENSSSTNTITNVHRLSFRFDEAHGPTPYHFVLCRIGRSASLSDTFLPPWRRGRTPVTIAEFLRGQKVPLHQRERATVLRLFLDGSGTNPSGINNDNDGRVVAVWVEPRKLDEKISVGGVGKGAEVAVKGRWVVHADFEEGRSEDFVGADEVIVIVKRRT